MEARVLVVDNNPVNAEVLCTCLQKLGCKTIVCKSGEEGLAEIARGEIAMIFIEFVLSSISGLDVLSAIRQKYDPIQLPVIMLSNLRDDKTLAEAISLGANDFLYKPINCKVTIARIYNQVLSLKLQKKNLKKKRNETIKSMIATYNHEINNTLSVAFAEIHLARTASDPTALNRVSSALKDISAVVRKIKDFSGGDIEEVGYLMGEKMLNLRTDAKI